MRILKKLLKLKKKLTFNEGLTLFVSFMSIAISVIAVYQADKIYKAYLNQELTTKQLDTVIELIDSINSSRIPVFMQLE